MINLQGVITKVQIKSKMRILPLWHDLKMYMNEKIINRAVLPFITSHTTIQVNSNSSVI